jgi:hypothetical protein
VKHPSAWFERSSASCVKTRQIFHVFQHSVGEEIIVFALDRKVLCGTMMIGDPGLVQGDFPAFLQDAGLELKTVLLDGLENPDLNGVQDWWAWFNQIDMFGAHSDEQTCYRQAITAANFTDELASQIPIGRHLSQKASD